MTWPDNTQSIPVRARTGPTTAFSDRKLDEEHGFTSAFLAKCGACGGELEFDTDGIGRSIDRCRGCGRVQLVSAPAPRPEGEAYSSFTTAFHPRRKAAEPKSRLPADDPAIGILREVRAQKAAAPMSPALAEAKREFDAYQASLKDGRKPGRPKLSVRRREPDPEMPGRPEWLTPPTPPAVPREATPPARTLASSTPTMAKTYDKTCKRSGRAFTAKGPSTLYCGVCPACTRAAAGGAAAPTPKADKPRKPIRTGYQGEPPGSTPASPSSGLSGAIDEIRKELTTLDERRAELRKQLREALESLQELADA